jgi:hypothetical protein
MLAPRKNVMAGRSSRPSKNTKWRVAALARPMQGLSIAVEAPSLGHAGHGHACFGVHGSPGLTPGDDGREK